MIERDAPAAQAGAAEAEPEQRRRLTPDDRRRQIVDGAIDYFAEVGFDGGTRNLAARLGVTQPLLYRYFPAKEDLIRAVYERLYVGSWKEEWSETIGDAGLPLRDRLVRFYLSYTEVIFDPRWIRIYLFAGLKGLEINRWWMDFVEQNVMRRLCGEIRRQEGLPGFDEIPLTAAEAEAFWTLHGGIFYYGVRREVFGATPRVAREAFVAQSVDCLLAALPAAARAALPLS